MLKVPAISAADLSGARPAAQTSDPRLGAECRWPVGQTPWQVMPTPHQDLLSMGIRAVSQNRESTEWIDPLDKFSQARLRAKQTGGFDMTPYEELLHQLPQSPKTWLITGVAGFIGSNLLEILLRLDQRVVGLDNLATGYQHNLDEVRGLVSPAQWASFQFYEGDICNLEDCRQACESVDYVLHQAALGSVPRSLADPIATNQANITGFLNMLVAARDAKVKSFTYAASSSTYGDHQVLPKVEDVIGKPLSPYAVTKYVNELYAEVFARCFNFNTIGLRYFNVFGPRQDPDGAYAAVIPKWTAALLKGKTVYVNGDGENSRDFCFVNNAVQANLLAASTQNPQALNQVYNVAVGDRTTLNQLYAHLRASLIELTSGSDFCQTLSVSQPVYRDFRDGDVRHSQADINKAQQLLAFTPTHSLAQGISAAMPWYLRQSALTM